VTFYGPGPESVPDSPVVWKTADGGSTWTPGSPLDTTDLQVFSVSHVFFAGEDGWVLAHVGAGMNHDYVVLYHSGDGGATWSRRIDPFTDGGIQSCQKTGLFFQDRLNGWLTGDCGGVAPGAWLYRTADGGQTWQKVSLPAPDSEPDLFATVDFICGVRSPVANDATMYFPVECTDYSGADPSPLAFLYSTADHGQSWSSTRYPGGGFSPWDAHSGWALGYKIHWTANGGQDWSLLSTVTWVGQFNFLSATHGFAVAKKDGGFGLVETRDAGMTWALLTPVIASES
jgi:hypothetical protein